MVDLQPHSPTWADDYRCEAERLTTALGTRVDAFEHIGSTAVPGLLAKPIIDVAARTSPGTDPFRLGAALTDLGYERHATGPKTHAVYVRRDGPRRTHILHIFRPDQWDACHQRLFRDRLRRDPVARQRYATLKEALAGLDDGRAYTAAKTALITELVTDERAARGLPAVPVWDK
ncbi:GrpB family protein [Frigoribacterium sp. CFBP 13605]|uniref:GrpB family protein n=1 Tax=Frigoribacterium sp. CFBP 13605 TaxID=2774034 RepID=UPI00190301D1|nr:GrpB family protein [Frigoribacterium sp. CFBP 13605]MBD8141202.1 GrpB family protein [Frigoribacterium sp. CFBP 13605]